MSGTLFSDFCVSFNLPHYFIFIIHLIKKVTHYGYFPLLTGTFEDILYSNKCGITHI